MVERRLSVLCVCISFLNDPRSCLGSLVVTSGSHASCSELEAGRVLMKQNGFVPVK